MIALDNPWNKSSVRASKQCVSGIKSWVLLVFSAQRKLYSLQICRMH